MLGKSSWNLYVYIQREQSGDLVCGGHVHYLGDGVEASCLGTCQNQQLNIM